MTYSYTQISQYLTCPRRYRHRYLDGWKETDTRAAMLFGRAFERALGAVFRREDPRAVLFAEWSECQNLGLHYSNGDSWDRMLRQGLMLLNRFCQDDRVQIPQPRRNLQIKFNRPVAGRNDFVAYIDAIGKLDGTRACWSGKPVRAATRKSRRDCCLWILNSFATPGSPALPKSPRSCSSASAWWRFSTCGPASPTSSAVNSATWWKTRSGELSPHSSYHTVAFAFRRTPAAAVHTSGCAWENRRWPMLRWCGVQEQTALFGLTSLITRNPPMPPKFSRSRALFVLNEIDEILAWERRREMERDTKFVELGRYLCEVRAGQYWRLENLKSFDDLLEKRFPGSRRKAYYLMSIHEHMPPQARKELKKIGWAKGIELAKLARRDGQHFDCATWLHKARELPKEEFQREVERELTGKLTEPWEIVYFKLYQSQMPIIEGRLRRRP